MKTTDEAPDLAAPPNATWAPVLEALEREDLRTVRIRWRRGYGRGRYQAGRAITIEEGDRVCDVLATLIEAAESVSEEIGIPIDYQVDAHTTNGRRLGPWRVTLDEPMIADTQAASESAFRMFRQSEQVIGRLLNIIQKQAEAQSANMERIGQLLDPLVRVRAMELDHEEWQREQEARERADERMFDMLERLGAAYLRKRYGIDLDDIADTAENAAHDGLPNAADDSATTGAQTDAEVMATWEQAAFYARNALTDEVKALLRRAHALKAWHAVAKAMSEAAYLEALDKLESILSRHPKIAAQLAQHPPVLAAHKWAAKARAEARRG